MMRTVASKLFARDTGSFVKVVDKKGKEQISQTLSALERNRPGSAGVLACYSTI
jgi:hypothetical protein